MVIKAEDDAWDDEEEQVRQEILARLEPEAAARVSDVMMTCFVRGYHYEDPRAEKTLEVLERALTWRADNGVDKLLDVPGDPNEPNHQEFVRQAKAYQKTFHLDIFGHDDNEHVLMCQRIGAIDPDKLMDTGIGIVKRHFIRDMEYIVRRKLQLSNVAQRPRYKHISILDFSGFGTRHCSARFRGPMKEVLDQLQFYYPEAMHKMYIVNAPMAFRVLWRMVKPWLHPVTVSRIDIIGGSYHSKLTENGIEISQLPTYLGGNTDPADGELARFISSGCVLPPDLRQLYDTEQTVGAVTPIPPGRRKRQPGDGEAAASAGGRGLGAKALREALMPVVGGQITPRRDHPPTSMWDTGSDDDDDFSGYKTPPLYMEVDYSYKSTGSRELLGVSEQGGRQRASQPYASAAPNMRGGATGTDRA